MARFPRLAAGAALFATGMACIVHAQAWSLDRDFAPVVVNDASVLAGTTFVPTATGQILAFGQFTHINGTPAPGLARLTLDGRPQPDLAFSAELTSDDRVSAVASLPDGSTLVLLGPLSVIGRPTETPLPGSIDSPAGAGAGATTGGNATAATGVVVSPGAQQHRLIRLRSDGRRDAAFAPIVFDNASRLTPLTDGRILAWGSFRTAGGLARNGLARLNADGTFDPTFAPSISSTPLSITAVAPAAEGGLVLSAVAYSSGRVATPTYFLTRVLASGVADPRFAPGRINTTYASLAVQPDGAVLAANAALAVVSVAVPADSTPAASVGSTPTPSPDPVVIVPPDGVVIPVPVTSSIVRFTTTGELDRTYNAQIPSLRTVSALLPLPDGRVAVGAIVGGATGLSAPAVFALTARGQLERDFRRLPGGGEGQQLLTALPDGRVLVLQGPLVLSSSYYAVPFDATAPAVTTAVMPIFFGATLVDPALALSFADASALGPLPVSATHRYPGNLNLLAADAAGRVLAAGVFTHVDGQPRAGLARFLASGRLDPSFSSAGGDLLFLPPDGRAILRRRLLGPLERDGFHRYVTQIVRLLDNGTIDTSFAFPTGFDPAQANWLLAAPDGRLLVSAFETDESREQNLKLIWLAADGRRLATLPTVFTEFTRYIAMPLDSAGAPISTDLVASLPIFYGRPNVIDAAQLLDGNRLLVAGAFGRVNGVGFPGLVRLLADGKEDATYSPRIEVQRFSQSALPLPDGRALTFGSSLVGGRWHEKVQRLRTDGTVDPTFSPPPDTIAAGAVRLSDGTFFSGGRRFFADGWPDLNFAPRPRLDSSTGAMAAALLTTDGMLWVGGTFAEIDSQPRTSLARFAPTEIVGITVGPRSQTVVAGRDAWQQVAIGTTQPASYRWTHNGVTLAGATDSTLHLSGVRSAQAGSYAAVVTVGSRVFTSVPAVLTVTPNTSRVLNFSARSRVVTGGASQIAGLVCTAPTPRPVLLRAVGNGLPANLGTTPLPVPVLTLYDNTQLLAQDRGGALAAAVVALARSVGAFPLNPAPVQVGAIHGSALIASLGTGTFSATTTSGDDRSGLSLFEFYDTGGETAPALVRNISLRGQTGTGAAALTAGCVLGGNGPLSLLVRGIGPTLVSFGVTDAIADPRLAIYTSASSAPLATNDDWAGTPELVDAGRRAGAFALPPASRDAALLLNLEPGAYSVQLTAANNATGTALIEIYVLEN